MSWLASIGVGLISGILGFGIAFLVAALAIEWYHVTQHEGAAGILGMGISLLALVVSIAFGIGCARHIAVGEAPSFLKALGLASSIIAAGGLVALAVVWLFSDPSPRWQGRRLELVVELRCPPDFTTPTLAASSDAYATIIRLPSGRESRLNFIDLADARTDAGRLIFPAVLKLETSTEIKLLNIQLGPEHELRFALEFGSKPTAKDQEWSRWIDPTYSAGTPPPAPERTFEMRYRVQKIPLPAPVKTREAAEAEERASIEAEYRALAADAPLAQWLRFTQYGMPEELQKEAVAAIRTHATFQQAMTDEILGSNPAAAREALRAFPYFAEPPLELAPAVTRFGADVVAELRALHDLSMDDPTRSAAAAEVSSKFAAWMDATLTLQGHSGVSFVPQLQEIAQLARKQPIDPIISINVLRVASYYLHTWAGIEPLPEDPPPR